MSGDTVTHNEENDTDFEAERTSSEKVIGSDRIEEQIRNMTIS